MWLQCVFKNRIAVAPVMAAAVFATAHPGLGANCPSVAKLTPGNIRPASVLSQLDLNRDGIPDGSPDTDGDGLPDSWEENVSIFAPTAIGPGTPSTFLTSRLLVTTDPCKADSDEDGLTDFVEVFGLKFIDDNRNGKLDFIFTDTNLNGVWERGEPIDGRSEWLDLNNDGMPSIGEYPLENLYGSRNNGGSLQVVFWVNDSDGDTIPDTVFFDVSGVAVTLIPVHGGALQLPSSAIIGGQAFELLVRSHDFDGFMFTDPKSKDTDGDGVADGDDSDPLINPATFGIPATGDTVDCTRTLSDGSKVVGDLDLDGLGNCSDFGNDAIASVDYPEEIPDLIELFRKDRLDAGTLPESLIEDLVGADWNGDGLFRITDIQNFLVPQRGAEGCFLASLTLASGQPLPGLESEAGGGAAFEALFTVGGHELFGDFRDSPPSACAPPSESETGVDTGSTSSKTDYAIRRHSLGLQTILLSFAKSLPTTVPDARVWTILYAWRTPGFDIDGDGFIGSPENNFRVDDRHGFPASSISRGTPVLDGRITAPQCGAGTTGMTATVALGFTALWWFAAGRRRRTGWDTRR